MEKETRNNLRIAVTKVRRLLEEEISDTLEGTYGIYASGKIDGDYKMRHLDDEKLHNREILIGHFEYIKSSSIQDADAVDQLKREIAFTHLNRLVAFKLMEQRKLIRETVSRGVKSPGVEFYLIDHPEDEKAFDTGDTETAYRNFLTWQAQQFEDEISVLFAHNDPANVIYPRQSVLDKVLFHINSEELAEIWTEDETIGWVYQYFTPKELRDKVRKESEAPRNSYELAFRNQFYTPRYVVEFLTDNTLGRTWYEMQQGNTALTETCRYLARRPNEIFMAEGEEAPEMGETAHLPQEELLQQPVYIPYRAYKDPRRLRILDPACGSGHFLLYCFDLLSLIYEEAWERNLTDSIASLNLRRDYPNIEALRRDIPRLILRHNLHGIDIDRRATQIAALALWLKAQRYYNDHAIKRENRPKITEGNIVLAEPMPGDKALLKEFTATLNPPVLGQLLERVFDKMQLAGEAGSLLKIEEAIQDDIKQAKKLWEEGPTPQQLALFPDLVTKDEYKQLELFDVSNLDDSSFFDVAEKRVLEALKDYAAQATNGKGLQRRLFAQDASAGFAFIEVLRKRFDIVLMNPPFGEASRESVVYITNIYSSWNKNLLCAFIERAWELSIDSVGVIFDRTAIVKSSYESFRKQVLLNQPSIFALADLGWEVLDANVEVSSILLRKNFDNSAIFVDVRNEKNEEKANSLRLSLQNANTNSILHNVVVIKSIAFLSLPNSVIGYDFPEFLLQAFAELPSLEEAGLVSYQGHALKAEIHYRLTWEILPNQISPKGPWCFTFKGGDYSPFYLPTSFISLYGNDGDLVPKSTANVLRNIPLHMKQGVAYGKRGEFLDVQILPSQHMFTHEGMTFPDLQKDNAWLLLCLLNSNLFQLGINIYCGQHKHSGYVNLFPYSHKLQIYIRDLINSASTIHSAKFSWYMGEETNWLFFLPHLLHYTSDRKTSILQLITNLENIRGNLNETISIETEKINLLVEVAYNVDTAGKLAIDTFNQNRPIDKVWFDKLFTSSQEISIEYVDAMISYYLGLIFGRWDIDYATGIKPEPRLPDPFAPLPVCPLGMLQNADGLPATETPEGYPLDIVWEGILVDDESHPDDIVRRFRDVLHLIWGDRSSDIENEILDILGEKSLRAYFQKTAKDGFWMSHVSRYTKSRRNAPIYWYLRSRNSNYGMWLYYHRFDKNMILKALTKNVRPKVLQLEYRIRELRGDKQHKDELVAAEDLLNEVLDFQSKLERVSALNLKPDLNDGVVLNIAPLHELVPWKDAKDYWNELLAGKYEWSSIAQQLRQNGVVK